MRTMRLTLTAVTLVFLTVVTVQAQIAHGYSNVFLLDTVTTVDDGESPPLTKTFMSVYPNPFNPLITIEFELAEAGVVELAIFDLQGRLVLELDNDSRAAGRYRVTWSGRNRAGHSVPAGTYLCRFNAAGESQTAKVTLVK